MSVRKARWFILLSLTLLLLPVACRSKRDTYVEHTKIDHIDKEPRGGGRAAEEDAMDYQRRSG